MKLYLVAFMDENGDQWDMVVSAQSKKQAIYVWFKNGPCQSYEEIDESEIRVFTLPCEPGCLPVVHEWKLAE